MGPCFSAKYEGEGHSIGSGTGAQNSNRNVNETAAVRRQRLAEAAEKRVRKAGGPVKAGKKKKPIAKPVSKQTAPTSKAKPTEAPPPQKPKTQTATSSLPASDRSKKLAQAAEQRAEAQYRGLSPEKQAEMKLRAEKDRLLGQITHYYRQSGKEVPFGLASCSPEQLKRHLEHAKGMKKA